MTDKIINGSPLEYFDALWHGIEKHMGVDPDCAHWPKAIRQAIVKGMHSPMRPHTRQPMETAPLDGTPVILFYEPAGTLCAALATYDADEHDQFQHQGFRTKAEKVGWWSPKHSVTQVKMEGIYEPCGWMPLPDDKEVPIIPTVTSAAILAAALYSHLQWLGAIVRHSKCPATVEGAKKSAENLASDLTAYRDDVDDEAARYFALFEALEEWPDMQDGRSEPEELRAAANEWYWETLKPALDSYHASAKAILAMHRKPAPEQPPEATGRAACT